MITLRVINEGNFQECIRLEVDDSQKSFVARNVYSLAQAWLYSTNALPIAIYNDETMVGFVMLGVDYYNNGSKKACGLWRLMIDTKHQDKGYGKAAMLKVIAYGKENLHSEEMRTSFVPGNDVAMKLYQNLGFVPTGEVDHGEVVMVLKF
jgi:diamine N-acetyltransferase